ncbi:CHAT domain-containing protein [Lentzea sp. NEAU-D13]|uniref:CHAT domain-containing protein n=1 Tax=Lentzea alba TaxID=2714351 RepID=A0A7C9RWQ2_9PSEU|nr:CHAT domain-containing protein [Lentzea alba]NGY65331.1 CHAT domain-containing protein [Lentzea alba]
MTDPALLLANVQQRLDRFTRHGNAEVVAGEDALHDLLALIQVSIVGDRIAADGVQACAWLAWYRYLATGSAAARAHAVDLFRQLARVRPDLVPPEASLETEESSHEVFENARQVLQIGVSTQDSELVGDAVRVLTELAELSDRRSQPFVHASLGGALLELFDLTGVPELLDRAIDALVIAEPTPQTRGALGAALLRRGDPRGAEVLRVLQEELDPREPIAVAARADLTAVLRRRAEDLEPGTPDWISSMIDLASAQQLPLGHPGTDDSAVIATYTALVDGMEEPAQLRGELLLMLALQLRKRYEAILDFVDVTKAIGRAWEAVPLLPEDRRWRAFGFLSRVLVERAHIRRSTIDAAEAARLVQDIPQESVQYGIALTKLFEFSSDPQHLAESEHVLLAALQEELSDDDRSVAWSALGDTYLFQKRLDESIDAQRRAVALAKEPGYRAKAAGHLATALAEHTADGHDEQVAVLNSAIEEAPPGIRATLIVTLAEAHRVRGSAECLELYRASAHDPALSSFGRVYAAHMWGWVASSQGDIDDAVTAYRLAVELLQLVAWRGLWRADQQRELARLNGLAPEAAAAALRAEQPRLALELLERGRSVLWAQLLDMSPMTPDPVAGTLPDAAVVQARMELADRLGEVQRSLPEIEQPVVVVNIGRSRCDAILLPSFEVVPLDTTFVEVSEQVHALQAIRASGGLASYAAAQETVVGVLEFAWHKIVRPVLDRMDADRLWWCPTGPASLLPLHAAGDYRDTGESALDRVVSSYASSLSSLSGNETGGGKGMLVVGASDLPGVAEEVEAVAARFPGCTKLVGSGATVERVREEITRHARVHIACHGKQNLRDPSQSHLALHDGPLTVTSLLDLRVSADFAFLSACEASMSTTLPDESIHLAAAVRYAGFREVIATLWRMDDSAGPAVASSVYASRESPAQALHEAVNHLRAAMPYEPAAWAPFIHIGP